MEFDIFIIQIPEGNTSLSRYFKQIFHTDNQVFAKSFNELECLASRSPI